MFRLCKQGAAGQQNLELKALSTTRLGIIAESSFASFPYTCPIPVVRSIRSANRESPSYWLQGTYG